MLPESLLRSLEGVNGFNRPSFETIHQSGEKIVSVRLNPAKPVAEIFSGMTKVPWSSYGYYLPERPSFIFDPLWHAGAYYVQEASSMFLEECIRQTTDLSKPLKVLDLCAAPGGKSTLLQSLLSPESCLVTNEVIKSRVNILTENITKWGAGNVIVTNNDPRDFSRLPDYFDLIVVDAPCSGSGLFRRDPHAVSEWSAAAVDMCSQRQQRILSDVYGSLQQHGVLVYSTCSYSREEDEDICDWICDHFDVTPVALQVPASWQIVETMSDRYKAPGYRFFPDRLKGEGFFIACFKKNDGHITTPSVRKNVLTKLPAKEKAVIAPWLRDPDEWQLYRLQEDNIFAFPGNGEAGLAAMLTALYVKKAGIRCGRLLQGELVPDHELALSNAVHPEIVAIPLKKEEALQYLRKEEVSITATHKGWALVQYGGLHLGWVKLLKNRANNYYPKEWRILKSANN